MGSDVNLGLRPFTYLKNKMRRLHYLQEFNDSQPISLYNFSRDIPVHVPVAVNAADY